ncbi:siroheme decarboxylase subunit beta [Microvirgula aerodenitrificans]|uniref:siroheme decarboxylase n=1 Tax=Microvirgula aerodenitrificans TaxID=57480 RepID=A0A2S0P9C7_9NEIS|nr:Lrp/AsnC family transcriptional regulator [Microvirgula aerodenitrificans]AVY93999.1 Lrp/AsnC family transcriptional regulator [Microvirgula aerodenitrificans]
MSDDRALFDTLQRDFPLQPRPYHVAAAACGLDEADLLSRLAAGLQSGRISRIGAVFAPNVIGASTLAALAVPPDALDEMAARVNACPLVNHNYARHGHACNLWFVLTGRDRGQLDAALDDIAVATGLPPLDLPLEREYHIDLGFTLDGPQRQRTPRTPVARPVLDAADWRLIAALERGLPLVAQPYEALAAMAGLSPGQVGERLRIWCDSGVIRRFGVVLRHREFGYRSNAMCVWDVPDTDVDAIGKRLAAHPAVNLCYRRPRRPGWPYNLFAMIHARSSQAMADDIAGVVRHAGLAPHPRLVLPSTTCYRQRGARYACEESPCDTTTPA